MTKRKRPPLEIHPKVAGGTVSGAVALIVLWILSYWIAVPPEVAAAFTLLLGSFGAWLTPADTPEER